MICHMGDRSCLSGSMSSFPRRTRQVSGRSVGMTGSIAGWSHGNLTLNPGVSQFDGPAGTFILRQRILEEVQHMLCTTGRPYCKKAMIGITQGAATTHGHKSGVSDFSEDHSLSFCPLYKYVGCNKIIKK
jgi:hypothetical protein